MGAALDQFKTFVAHAEAAAYYSKWASQNPVLATRWAAYRDAILAGKTAAAPDMDANEYGKMLVAGGGFVPILSSRSGPLQILGTPAVGATLTASQIVGVETYQWQRSSGTSWSDISGATGLTYTPVTADAGNQLRLATIVAGVRSYTAPITVPASAAGLWVPTPPTVVSNSGTFAFSTLDTIGGDHQIYAKFYPSWQHDAATRGGTIFSSYSYTITGDHVTEYWRVKKSTDHGATWTTVYSVASPDTGNDPSPAIEVDENDNLYVFVSKYSRNGTYPLYQLWMYVFSPADGYTTPTVIVTPAGAAGKFTTHYDQTRGWFWTMIWEPNSTAHPAHLWAFDKTGALKYSKSLWQTYNLNTSPSLGANSLIIGYYPVLTVDHAGNVYVGWCTLDVTLYNSGAAWAQNYYSCHFIWTTDGGTTWKGANGSTVTLPIAGDSAAAVMVPDATNAAEIVLKTAAGYGTSFSTTSWNLMSGFAFHKGKLHVYYETSTNAGQFMPADHNPYARYSFATNSFDKRTLNFQSGNGVRAASASGGSYVQDSTQTGRIYFVSQGGGAWLGYIVAWYSDDGGDTWNVYATGAVHPGTGVVYPQAFRYTLSDGSIVGSFYDAGVAKAFRITPA